MTRWHLDNGARRFDRLVVREAYNHRDEYGDATHPDNPDLPWSYNSNLVGVFVCFVLWCKFATLFSTQTPVDPSTINPVCSSRLIAESLNILPFAARAMKAAVIMAIPPTMPRIL